MYVGIQGLPQHPYCQPSRGIAELCLISYDWLSLAAAFDALRDTAFQDLSAVTFRLYNISSRFL